MQVVSSRSKKKCTVGYTPCIYVQVSRLKFMLCGEGVHILSFLEFFIFKTFCQQPIKISARFYWHSDAFRSHAQQECSFIPKFQEVVCVKQIYVNAYKY